VDSLLGVFIDFVNARKIFVDNAFPVTLIKQVWDQGCNFNVSWRIVFRCLHANFNYLCASGGEFPPKMVVKRKGSVPPKIPNKKFSFWKMIPENVAQISGFI